MRYAELFAGAGGLSLGLDRAGWECAFHAEIADFPRRVLRAHWPDTPLYGDVLELNGRELMARHGAIDLLSGGSPCQDLSVAGKRAGLTEGSGTRSSLFHEQIRIWDETGADLCLWENVDGARNSNKGADFAAVLSAFVGGTILVPSIGWRSSGVATGPSGVAAWRVFDAQYFGVPQRRRRVFVLCSRTGRTDPSEVLSLSESLSGDTPASRAKREKAAAGAGASSPVAFNLEQITHPEHRSTLREGAPAPSLTGKGASHVMAFGSKFSANDATENVSRTLTTGGGGSNGGLPPAVMAFKPSHFSRGKDGAPSEIMPPLTADADRGDQEAIILSFKPGQSEAAGATFVTENIVPTLQGENNGSTAVPAVLRMVGFGDYADDGTASSIKARDYKDATDLVIGTLDGTQRQQVDGAMAAPNGVPRRLLPIECERLMDWPDNWTNISDEKGKPASDSARYRAIGNGVVSAVPEWIGRRIIALRPL